MAALEYTDKGAEIDDGGRYRYSLWRTWDPEKPRVLFVMLNPSAADGFEDDPTIRKCVRLANSWGYGRLDVVNLFAVRSSDPAVITQVDDPVGAENDQHIAALAAGADLVVAAWGDDGSRLGRSVEVLRILTQYRDVSALSITKAGEPRHPRFLAEDLRPQVHWRRTGGN